MLISEMLFKSIMASIFFVIGSLSLERVKRDDDNVILQTLCAITAVTAFAGALTYLVELLTI